MMPTTISSITHSTLTGDHEGPFYWIYLPSNEWELRISEGGTDHIAFWPAIVAELIAAYQIDSDDCDIDENGDPDPTYGELLKIAYRCFPRGRVVRGHGLSATIIVGDMPQELPWDEEYLKLVDLFSLNDYRVEVEKNDSHETIIMHHKLLAEKIMGTAIPEIVKVP